MIDVGKAITAAMQDQRERDSDRVTWSEWLGFVRVDGLLQRRRLTLAEVAVLDAA